MCVLMTGIKSGFCEGQVYGWAHKLKKIKALTEANRSAKSMDLYKKVPVS